MMNDREMQDAGEEHVMNEGARSGVSAGTHAYGYVEFQGPCVLKRPGCSGQSSTMCHDRYVCIPCLHLHKHDLERDGVGMEFKGTLGTHRHADGTVEVIAPSQVNAVDAREGEFRGVLKVLHELYAAAVNTGGQSDEENEAIFARAREVLTDYGIQV